MKSFFDRHPQFFETSKVGNTLPDGSPSRRLHNRHLGIIEANRKLFEGASVLDIASHDGRWSLAALDAGASHVVGIEGRHEAFQSAEKTFEQCGISRERYRFEVGDVFDVMERWEFFDFDLILCLGFMYHTPRHWDLFRSFKRISAKHIILDTKIGKRNSARPYTHYMEESTDMPGCALPQNDTGQGVVGVPSAGLIHFMARHFGFEAAEIDWSNVGIEDWRGCEDIESGERRAYVLTADE